MYKCSSVNGTDTISYVWVSEFYMNKYNIYYT